MIDIINVQGLPFLACLAMLAILGYIGIHVLKREVIFIDIALAQIAAVGAVAAQIVFHVHGGSAVSHGLALGATLVAAAFFALVRRRVVQIPLEAVIGVSYAVSAAAALFLVGISPGGHVHIQEMLSGSILWVTSGDLLWSTVVFAAVGSCFYIFRKPFRTISDDYDGAVATGFNTLGWDFLFYALVGVVITAAVRVAGVVVVFTFLIIPSTLSAVFASGWSARLFVAWATGAVSAALGLLFADRFDFSVGPAIALFLGGTLIIVGLLRLARVGSVVTAAVWLVLSVAVGVWFDVGFTADHAEPTYPLGGVPHAGSITHTHSHGDDPADEHAGDSGVADHELDPTRLGTLSDVAELEALYAEASDGEERSMVVCRTLEVDVHAGVSMAIDFLRGDPPLLFRLTVIDKLGDATGMPVPYNIDEPFDSPANQKAVADLKRASGAVGRERRRETGRRDGG